MKVAFITDYPLNIQSRASFSGAEVSTALLGQQLAAAGIEVKVIPSTQASYLPLRLTTNPLWFFWSAVTIGQAISHFQPDILHIHGKNALIGTFLANLLFKKPLVVTVRDYRPLCDLGMCLLRSSEICDLKEYWLGDIPYFIRHYKKSRISNYLAAYLISPYQLALRPVYHLVLKKADRVICLSQAQQTIYNSVGITNTVVIYNPAVFSLTVSKQKQVFFGGRYTLGKGKEILEEILPRLRRNYPDWKVVMVGKNTSVGQVSYGEYRKLVGQSALALVPSVWPEPFGRAALDALAMGTPVITTNRGGLPEIVINNRYGLVVEPDPQNFWRAVETGLKNYKKWVQNIKRDQTKLAQKFTYQPVAGYRKLYESILSLRLTS